MTEQYCVYILPNDRHTVLYAGETGDLRRRLHQHREKLLPGFTRRHNVSKLVYYSITNVPKMRLPLFPGEANRGWFTAQEVELINRFNPQWRELYDEI